MFGTDILIKLLVGALVSVGLLFATHLHGVSQGKDLERAEWQDKEIVRMAAEKTASDKSIADGITAFKEAESAKQGVVNDHLKEIQTIRNYYERNNAPRLRLPSSSCNNTTTNSKVEVGDTSRVNEDTAASIVLPEQVERDLRQLARDSDEITAVARSLQQLLLQCKEIKELPE